MTPLAAYLLLFLAVGIGFIFVHLLAGKLIRPNRPNAEKGTVYECGEPTIGSAWVQFDLRFYVVALLFVIFDVEVAFFFPWAEVFGKANAIANIDNPMKKDQRGNVVQWPDAAWYRDYAGKALDLAAPATSSTQQMADVRRLEGIVGRTADGKLLVGADGKPIGPLNDAQLEKMLADQKTLKEKSDRLKASGASGQGLESNPALRNLLGMAGIQLVEADMTPAESVEAAREGPLSAGQITRTQDEARTLAWMALGEVLVFFGVLLVGFAYLWRRGDLKWVRSTAAERPETMPPTPPLISFPAAPRETVGAAGPH